MPAAPPVWGGLLVTVCLLLVYPLVVAFAFALKSGRFCIAALNVKNHKLLI